MDVDLELAEQLGRRTAGFSLPQKFYTDPTIFRLDLERIFYRTWLFAGHDCEVPRRGSYVTLQIGDYPIIVVRSGDGEIRAFHNTCRHRGSRICAGAKGTAVRLVCPYHQWSYGLDGRLMQARRMGDDFDKARFGLKPVACRSVAGYVFVCLDQEPPPFEPVRALIEPYFVPHQLKEAKIAFEEIIVERGNWKLVWENNRECYHCAGSHPELCRTYPETPTITGVDGARRDPVIAAHWQRCEAAGLPSDFRISDDGDCRVVRMPLLGESVSYTMTGDAAVGRALAEIGERRLGTLMLFHYPSSWNHVLQDHAVSFRVTPLGPCETQLTTRWLVHKDAVEGVDYQLDELIHVWRATNDQDRQIVEENQRGINSPAYEPGPYAPEDEGGVSQFVDWYCAAMRRSLPPSPVKLREVA